MRLIVVLVLLAFSSPVSAAKRLEGTGFTCTASDGSVRRLNIDLRKSRYDDGEGVKNLYRVTDTKIEIEGPNRYMAADPDPYFHTIDLDRSSLIMTDRVLEPKRGIRRETLYQCIIGPLIVFSAGQKF